MCQSQRQTTIAICQQIQFREANHNTDVGSRIISRSASTVKAKVSQPMCAHVNRFACCNKLNSIVLAFHDASESR